MKAVSQIYLVKLDETEEEKFFGVRVAGDSAGSYYEMKYGIRNRKLIYLGVRKVLAMKTFETICTIDGYSLGDEITNL